MFHPLLVFFFVFAETKLICNYVNGEVDIKTQLVKIKASVVLKNVGPSSESCFVFITDPQADSPFVRFYGAEGNVLNSTEEGKGRFLVDFHKHLDANESFSYIAEVVYLGQILPCNKTIKYKQKHAVVYEGNLLYYSPYETIESKTVYTAKSAIATISVKRKFIKINVFGYEQRNTEPYSAQFKLKFRIK